MARHAIAETAAQAGLDERVAAAAQVVVTEGFTNAARHGTRRPDADSVEINASGDSGGITIVVRDHGPGFRPRIPDAVRAGGFGLALIASLADRLELVRHPDGTEMRARLEGSSPPAAGRNGGRAAAQA